MTQHTAVARRFAELMQSLDLDRAGFVAAVDEAISERTLYSILNGHRRPSRSLAVLIERTWGFRADYLLAGEGPAWAGTAASEADVPSDDAAAILAVLAGSPELARTMRRDLDDSILWTDLWQRTTRMLEGLVDADRAGVAFAECMSVADAFGELSAARYQRRLLHLVVSFIGRALEDLLADPASGLERDTFEALLAEAEQHREQLGERERDLRGQLMARVQTASPLDELAMLPPAVVSSRLLSNRIREVLARHRLTGG